MTPLETLVQRIVVREGGVKDVGDGKGVTRFGQTPDWLAQFQLPAPASPEAAASNYLTWIGVIGFHPLVDAGDDLADILLDVAVMSDHHKAIKALQAAIGITADGLLGPETLAAIARAASREILAHLVIAWDMEYQGRLITLQPSRAVWAAGWAARMAGHVRNLV